MREVIERNGIIYLKDFPEDFDWTSCTIERNGTTSYYFPLNETTRECFKQDILPLIKQNLVSIDMNLYNKIRTFKQNQEITPNIIQLNTPTGITLEPHQNTALKYMYKYARFGLFLGTGTGKTLIAITWLMNAKPKTCLIVTPQKAITQYQAELNKYIPNSGYIVTNYEQLHKYLDNTYEALILDESHKAKSFTSQTNIQCRVLASKAKYVYLFTGTPQDKSRHEILAQLAILDQRVMPVKTRIYDRYFNIDDYFQPKTEKRERKNELTRLINAYTWGKKTEDAIDLQKSTDHIVECPHPKQYYDTLFNQRLVIDNDLSCVADNKGVLKVYLREICSGCLTFKTQDEQIVEQTFPTTKSNSLVKLASSIDRAVLYYEFTSSLKDITQCLDKANRSYVIVNGMTSAKKSGQLIEQFKRAEVDYLVIQSRSGNAALDLPMVNNVIFYALPESYIVYSQCKGRINRKGQTKECNYWHLICKDTVEVYNYDSLKKKKSFTDKVFSQYV